MDTRFWGPSGWRLLHSVAHSYDPTTPKARQQMRKFLKSLPYILPCKFCRSSLSTYYTELPYAPHIQSNTALFRWLYNIHNKVNEKLRSQGLNPSPDPSFHDVQSFYSTWIRTSTATERLQIFWDFLFSVAYCHPTSSVSIRSTPMPNCPKRATQCRSHTVRNRWNTLPSEIRLKYYNNFWNSLPDILEPELSVAWHAAQSTNPPTLQTRQSTTAWLWRMRCALDPNYADPYASCCRRIADHSSECGSKKRAITCRRSRRKPT